MISLPKDTKAHHSSNIEWWYYFAFLKGDNGGKYATMGSFFLTGDISLCKGHYLIFSLINLTKNSHQSYSFADRNLVGNLLLMLPSLIKRKLPTPHQKMGKSTILSNPTRLLYGKSSLSFTNDIDHHFNVYLVENSNIINLEFKPKKPIALIGGYGKPDELFYYSFTRNSVEGYIKKGDKIEKVRGEGWFDHQWGHLNSFIMTRGWNWFGLQLDDGRELLINEFLDIKTGKTFSPMANLIHPNGDLKFTKNVILEPIRFWRSPTTKARYPIEWVIIIPDFNMKIKVTPKFNEQEMRILGPPQSIWEGVCLVQVYERLTNRTTYGKGFTELVGYALNTKS